MTIIFFCKFKYKGHPAIHSSLPRYKGKLIRYTNKKTWTPNVFEMACFLKAYVFIITLLIIPKKKSKQKNIYSAIQKCEFLDLQL